MSYPIIDCHCHIYPDRIADKAVEGISKFYDLPMSYNGRATSLIDEGEKIGVKHNIIFSVATTPKQVSSINSFISDTNGNIILGFTLTLSSVNSIADSRIAFICISFDKFIL